MKKFAYRWCEIDPVDLLTQAVAAVSAAREQRLCYLYTRCCSVILGTGLESAPRGAALHHMIDWDDVRYFLAVARGGSVRAAAERLKVNHSTVLRRKIGRAHV